MMAIALRMNGSAPNATHGFVRLLQRSGWRHYCLDRACGAAFTAAADEAEAQLRLAARQLAENNTPTALASATASLAARPTTAGYQLRAMIQSRAGLHAEAIADLDASIKLDPKDANAFAARRGAFHARRIQAVAGGFRRADPLGPRLRAGPLATRDFLLLRR